MLVRVAACAAWFFAWPVCAGIDGTTLPLPGIASAMAQEQTALAPLTAVPVEAQPFGIAAVPVTEGEILRKWMGTQPEIRADDQVLARCRQDTSSCSQAARRFLAIVDEGRVLSGRARIGVINRDINLAIVPTSDVVQWGVADHWSAPLETFTTQRGDCEDYAIAKYVALRAAGLAPEDVRLVVVRNTDGQENHAVVAVRLDNIWMILDNRWLALVPDRQLWRATPLFEIDEHGVRQFVLAPALIAKLQQSPAASF
ncbi:MAG: transglutaminase-like cysteine peptidase [Xanthobacteraceae bacterium]